MNGFILIAALAILPQGELPERCDLLEINHLYDGEGREVFTQNIAWDWHPRHGKHHVACWSLCKEQQARFDFTTGEWVLRLKEKEFRAPTWRETWTMVDPEREDCETWPKEWRRLKP